MVLFRGKKRFFSLFTSLLLVLSLRLSFFPSLSLFLVLEILPDDDGIYFWRRKQGDADGWQRWP
jgi:hypothetical protein